MPKKISVVDKTPPLPRKTFYVHKTTLDPPCLEQNFDGLDITTEGDSGEDSTSWQKTRKFKLEDRKKKIKKRYMPPELIVTPAQVFETLDLCDRQVSRGKKSM